MKITQVTMFCKGTVGGQETYAENIDKIMAERYDNTSIVQIYRKGVKEKNVITLPYTSRFNKCFSDAGWFLFNIDLMCNKKYLKQSDILIVHYPFHYPAVSWHPRVIVLSHGIDWHHPQVTYADRYRMKTARMCRENSIPLVANDSAFLTYLGYNKTKIKDKNYQQIDKNVWFIPNCVDTGVFCPDNSVSKEDSILVPRNIGHARGIHSAIEFFNVFHRKNNNFKMYIAGGPLEGDYYQECFDLVKKYELEDNIVFLGFIHPDEMVSLYRKTKVTLIPSIEREGTSLSALESMACGTPVVSTDVGGLSDLPTIKTKNDPEHMSNAVNEVLDRYNYYQEKQVKCIEDVFNMKLWREAWYNVCDTVMKD
ncbi:MAG: glycosyltransferase family 4 protein [Candidatus Ancaeobacter aquaticus]|nr:glycosyltransferase family 4 protein [Candidatus Ancaeobacter aquaticus]